MAKKAKKRVVKKATKKMTILPKKMSSLIKIALADIRKAEQLPNKFVIDMMTWYDPDRELVCKLGDSEYSKEISRHKVCVMCAAGSVLAFSLGGNGKPKTGLVEKLEEKNDDQLQAIDDLRQGDVKSAAWALGVLDGDKEKDIKISRKLAKLEMGIPSYDMEDPEPFHKAMKVLEGRLCKAGF